MFHTFFFVDQQQWVTNQQQYMASADSFFLVRIFTSCLVVSFMWMRWLDWTRHDSPSEPHPSQSIFFLTNHNAALNFAIFLFIGPLLSKVALLRLIVYFPVRPSFRSFPQDHIQNNSTDRRSFIHPKRRNLGARRLLFIHPISEGCSHFVLVSH